MRRTGLASILAMTMGATFAQGATLPITDPYTGLPEPTVSTGSARSKKAPLTKSQQKNRNKAKAGRKAGKQRRK